MNASPPHNEEKQHIGELTVTIKALIKEKNKAKRRGNPENKRTANALNSDVKATLRAHLKKCCDDYLLA